MIFTNCTYHYDEDIDAIHIDFNTNEIYDSSVDMSEKTYFFPISNYKFMCIVDLSENDTFMGIEFIDFSKALGFEFTGKEIINYVKIENKDENIIVVLSVDKSVIELKLDSIK